MANAGGYKVDLKRRQELFLDTAELSFEFVGCTYSRLLETFRRCDLEHPDSSSPNERMLNAWGIVDHAERLREILEHTPGLKQTDTLRCFTRKLRGSVKPFRDHFQHMEEKAARIASSGFPIWRSLSWCKAVSEKTLHIGTFIPGRLAKCKGLPIVNPLGRAFHGDVDHVELSVGQDTINLSELCREIERFGTAFGAAVSTATSIGERDSNGLLRFEITFVPSAASSRTG